MYKCMENWGLQSCEKIQVRALRSALETAFLGDTQLLFPSGQMIRVLHARGRGPPVYLVRATHSQGRFEQTQRA